MENIKENVLHIDKLIHGTFVNVFDSGVLLIGKPKSGKSSIALELVSNGHALIADDLVRIKKKDSCFFGKSITTPKQLTEFIHINNYGFINLRKLFGDNGVFREEKKIDLIIKLGLKDLIIKDDDFKQLRTININTQDIKINIAKFIEIVIKNYKLEKDGYNSDNEFTIEQIKAITTKT